LNSLTDASSKVGQYNTYEQAKHNSCVPISDLDMEIYRKLSVCASSYLQHIFHIYTYQQYLIDRRINSFTTIDPQRAIGYLQIECACQRYNVSDKCKPNYGGCTDGQRSVPIELLDVAGLVPGAHEGKGLGNKFLDDLRHADALVHVVDVSGTTDAEG
jgi:50S ribosome-binding GTPase